MKDNLDSVAQSVVDAFDSTTIDDRWSFAEYSRKETSKWTHGYHRYPAKFIPQLVECLFDEYIDSPEAHINDPFFGSGTTIVSALSRGYRASGTDINPIAYLMTKVKATPIEPVFLKRTVERFLSKIKKKDSRETKLVEEDILLDIPQQHIERIDYWFKEDTKFELGKILRHIRDEGNTSVREFLLVGFSQILKTCSIWLQNSTKPTRDFTKRPREPYEALKKHLNAMVRGNSAFYRVVPERVKDSLDEYLNITLGDARKQPVRSNSVDLIVSSSPYVTSYEYADLHQLSTIWLKLTEDLKEYRTKFIGSSSRPKNNRRLRSEIAKKTVEEMREESSKFSEEIASFFLDMEQVFDESYRIVRPGGRCCFIIGNTALKGVKIPNAQIFAESIQRAGFAFDRLLRREIPSKILPQTRDKETGRFASTSDATSVAYPVEFIIVGEKRA